MIKFPKSTNRDRQLQNGITIIALIITIIVMLILAGVSMTVLFDEDGVITRARLSTFAEEMTEMQDKVDLKKNEKAMELLRNKDTQNLSIEEMNKRTFGGDDGKESLFNINGTDDYDVPLSLKREILYARKGYPEDDDINEYEEGDIEEAIGKNKYIEANDDGYVKDIYIIDKETADGKENKYIWDMKTNIVYKIPKTKIGKNVYHSYNTTMMALNPTGEEVKYDVVIEDESEFEKNGDIAYYSPNLKGFSKNNTKLIYYSQTYLDEVSKNSSRSLSRDDYIELSVQDYINLGKPAKLQGSEFPDDEQTKEPDTTYVFHDYANQVWGNVKTDASGLECWWVWIPRYAYKIIGQDSNPAIDVKYIDLNNETINKEELLEYIIHPAFTTTETNEAGEEVVVDQLKGIWMSKYEPSYTQDYIPMATTSYAPDTSGFDKNNTYIEIYDSEGNNVEKEVLLKDADLGTINDENEWYDYSNNKWANVKTTANGLECWWVWIPRYAYKIVDGVTEVDVIFIDTKNRPMDKTKFGTSLPEGYIVHPAFTTTDEDGTTKQLKGIWMSKYEPSNATAYTPMSAKCYAPNMEGFDENNTCIEIYNSDGSAVEQEILLKDADLSTINAENKWYDYANNKWANVKTTANGIECWWVWIPRYAYIITENITDVNIIFIDKDNKPIDTEAYGETLSPAYIIHPAFMPSGDDGSKNLEGIWMSKYEPSNTFESTPISTECYAPDMTGFDEENTYIEIFDSAGNNVVDEKLLKNVNLDTINTENNWYDYANNKWANIKTNANGIECWWVWIPRFAYIITENITETNIIFIDLDNKPIDKEKYGDTLPEGYIVHPAFTPSGDDGSKNLKGIWMSKYEPSWIAD